MGNGEAATPSKTDKASSSMQEQTSVHAYPDWAAMQAYYGPGIAMPPYFSTTVTAGHAPHPYVWGPQPLMPPFGAPYPAIYSHGGVYAHPSLPLGGQAVVASTASESATVTQETLTKSSSKKDSPLTKKLKRPDGLAGTVSSGGDKNEAGGTAHAQSQSTEGGTEGSSDGSDGNNNQTERKQTLEDTAAGKPVVSGSVPAVDVRTTAAKTKISALVPLANSAMAPNHDGVHPELWIQDERELKRERRKQSNRESARRSRLRKQAETEELAQKVEILRAENLALKSEIGQLSKNSSKLRQENSALLDKLNNVRSDLSLDCPSDKMEHQTSPTAGTENFLSKINESTSIIRSEQQEENRDNSTKLHQLLESSPRADAVMAG